MKTIEINSAGNLIQFTTKSVIIDGKEYPYSGMSRIRVSKEKRIYAFKFGDEVKYIPYAEEDARVVDTIFFKVIEMKRASRAARGGAAETPPGDEASEDAGNPNAPEDAGASPNPPGTPEDSARSGGETEDSARSGEAKPSKDPDAIAKAKRLKKSIIIFVIILVIFAAAGLGWYHLFGPAIAPSNPAVNEEQQYNDIDELIQDLE